MCRQAYIACSVFILYGATHCLLATRIQCDDGLAILPLLGAKPAGLAKAGILVCWSRESMGTVGYDKAGSSSMNALEEECG